MNKKISILFVVALLILFATACKRNEVVNMNNANINALSIKSNIIVEAPKDNDEIGQPVLISGQARVFENQLNYRIKDSDGGVLAEGGIYAQSPDAGQYGPFEVETTYTEPKTETGIIEVFDYSAKDGEQIDTVTIPVQFNKTETLGVKVFFGSETLNPGAMDCTKVFSVERIIPKTQGTAKAALEELLKGPTDAEKIQGYFSSINSGVKLQSITITDGVAKADFDETLEFQVGGSCRVASIAAQITETLKQFPTIESVIISINGRTKDILQP